MKFVFAILLLVCQVVGAIRPGVAAESKAAWQAEWERTVLAAEKEGQVMVSIGGYGAIIDSGVFQKTYPKIKVTHMTGAGTDLTQRISAERRAGKYLVDVYNGGGNSLFQVLYQGKMLDPIKPSLILPEVTDATKWWEGKQKYADQEGQYILVYEGNVSAGAGGSYNSQLIDPREYKSYWDLLNPKLKGKILSTDIRKVRGAGIPWQFLYYHSDLGPKYLRRLFGEMDVTLTADLRQAVDWLATGKFAVGMPIQGGTVYKAKNQGLPVDDFSPYHLKEGVNLSSAFGSLAVMNRAPHPNAAKVFINWLLSREGQTLFQKVISIPGDARNSRRIDVPKYHIPADEQRRDKMSYFDTDDPDTKDLTPLIKLLDEILGVTK
ncbi:MAG TPA: extracellular solute-binding protein [Candidatus Limnocylindrales bacterium]|nr:extracellular solute-binding protein [Candidatus Limnocylindrales bacterium]